MILYECVTATDLLCHRCREYFPLCEMHLTWQCFWSSWVFFWWLLFPYNQGIQNGFFLVYDYIYNLHLHGTITKKDSHHHHHHWSRIINYHFYCYSNFINNFWRYGISQVSDAMGCTFLCCRFVPLIFLHTCNLTVTRFAFLRIRKLCLAGLVDLLSKIPLCSRAYV